MTKAPLTEVDIGRPDSKREKAFAVLGDTNSTLMQLTQAVLVLEEGLSRAIKVGVSSSVTVDLLNLYLRKLGLMNGLKIEPVPGNYDDPVGDVDLFMKAGVEQMVLLPFFDNLMPSFEAQLGNLPSSIIETKENEIRQRYRMVFEKARYMQAVYLGTFHRMGSLANVAGEDAVAIAVKKFNTVLREEAAAYANIRIIDTEDIVFAVGQQSAFDRRFYFINKAPYTRAYLNELARRIAAAMRGFGTHFYKVLALDCDNTLWGGVIGEDLLEGIKLDPYDYPGNIFWRIQQEFAALERQGVLLALVTKNNPEDVDEVLRNHPNIVLKDQHIVVRKVNWENKPSNLRALAKELNIGLESFVFLDDSSFECEAVRQQLPMVKTVQVPRVLSNYPDVVAEIKALFLAAGITDESKGKTEQYRKRASAEQLKAQFDSQEDYLASLELKVELSRNSRESVSRISELSQKSNQFNLTTQRYSVSEIGKMIEGNDHAIYSLVVYDKFGSAGLTGVAVIRYQGHRAMIENFFMSCRVIGRGIETVIWPRIVGDAAKRGCSELCATFRPSSKNAQVADFYDRLGMPLINEDECGERHYSILISDFTPQPNPWIEMRYVE